MGEERGLPKLWGCSAAAFVELLDGRADLCGGRPMRSAPRLFCVAP